MEETKEEPKPTEEVLCDLTAVFGTKDPCVLTESPESFDVLNKHWPFQSIENVGNPPSYHIQYCDDKELELLNSNPIPVRGESSVESIARLPHYRLQFKRLSVVADKSFYVGPKENRQKYTIVKHISYGMFGLVALCKRESDGVQFIVKIISTQDNELSRIQLLNEVIVQHCISSVDNSYVPRIESVCIGTYRGGEGFYQPRERTVYILMEFIDGMDVYSYICTLLTDIPRFNTEIPRIMLELANISDILYKKYEFNHGDIKSDNLLIRNSDKKIMLIDFGFSTLKMGKGEHTIIQSNKFVTKRHPTRDTTMLGIDFLTMFEPPLRTGIMPFLQKIVLTIQCDLSNPYLAGTIKYHPPDSMSGFYFNAKTLPTRYAILNEHNNILATPENIRKAYSELYVSATTGAATTATTTTGATFGGGVRRKRASKTSKNKRTRTSKNKHMRTSRRKTLYRTNRTRTRNRTRTQFGGTLTLTNTNIDLTPFNHVSKEFYLHYLRFTANQGISLEKEVMRGILMDAVRNDNPAIWQYAIDAYLGESDPDTAIQLLRRLIALPPESREAFIQWTNTSSPEIRKFNIERKPYNVPYIPFAPFTPFTN